jgi:hypothetical protein
VLRAEPSVHSSQESAVALIVGTGLGDRFSGDRTTSARRPSKKKAICWPFVKPSDGLEPSTPSLPLSNEEGSEGTTGKPRAGKPRKKKEWFEEE